MKNGQITRDEARIIVEALGLLHDRYYLAANNIDLTETLRQIANQRKEECHILLKQMKELRG